MFESLLSNTRGVKHRAEEPNNVDLVPVIVYSSDPINPLDRHPGTTGLQNHDVAYAKICFRHFCFLSVKLAGYVVDLCVIFDTRVDRMAYKDGSGEADVGLLAAQGAPLLA